MSDASKLKVLYKAALPREGCQISRPLQKTLGAEAKPKPGKPLCVKPATNPEKLRGNPLQTSVETLGNPRQTVEACVEFWKQETHGNLQEPRRKFAGTHRKPAGNLQETRKKPAGDPWKTWKTCSVETCAETQTKPAKHLGKETREGNLYEAQSNLQQSCGNSQETCLWETWKPGKPRTTWILAL